jgi:hypothetical protein
MLSRLSQGLVGLYEKREDWSKLGSSYESLIAAYGKTYVLVSFSREYHTPS